MRPQQNIILRACNWLFLFLNEIKNVTDTNTNPVTRKKL